MSRVSEKIIMEAEEKAREIRNESESEIERLTAEEEEAVRKLEEEWEEKITLQKDAELKRQKNETDLSFRMELLREKHRLLDSTLKEAARALIESPESLTAVISGLLKAGIQTGNEEIVASPEVTKLIEGRILNELKDQWPGLHLSDETLKEDNGFILREGTIEFNATIDVVLKELYEKEESTILRLLFSEDEDNKT